MYKFLFIVMQFNGIAENPPGVMSNEGILHCFYNSWKVCEGEECREVNPPSDRSLLVDFSTLILYNCRLVQDGEGEFTSCKPIRTTINPENGRIDFSISAGPKSVTRFSIFGKYGSKARTFEVQDTDGDTGTIKIASGSCNTTKSVLVIPPPVD